MSVKRLTREKALWRIGCVFWLLLLAGCGGGLSAQATGGGETIATVVGATAVAAAPTTLAAPTAARLTAVPTPPAAPPPAAPALPTAAPTPVWAQADGVRCGVLLPLVAEPAAPPVQQIAGALPAGLAIPVAAQPALAYLLQNPAHVGLVAYRVGLAEQGVYLNGDAPMPLASIVKLIHLVAYAEAVEDGRFNPASWLPVSELERFFLPGSDLRSHPQAISELSSRGLVSGDPPAFPLEELPWMMLRNSSNAATDYLHLALGQETLEATALKLGLAAQTAPCPFLGQFLTISNHTRTGDNETAIRALIADPERYGREVMDLTLAYSASAEFREAEGRWYQRSRRPSWEAQSLFSENLNAQGTAREYADLMAKIVQNGLRSSYVNILVRRNLEWPLSVYPINQELFYTVGYKNGSLPGILNTLYYASPRDGGGLVVVALFFRHLPQATYREWQRTLTHDELARWLLTDPQAIPALRALLE